ncbi:hypothetical protein BBP40_005615 [Aspergillus hancockii]|nr:hypothetical protein BBP40_005615 [Aspergillus hancockii]
MVGAESPRAQIRHAEAAIASSDDPKDPDNSFSWPNGGCVAILANTVAGIIGNVRSGDRTREIPVSLYITTYLTTSNMGPVFGASIFQYLSWRWRFLHRAYLDGRLLPSVSDRATGKPIPEARLYAAIIGGIVGNTGGMFEYAWTSYSSLPFIAPTIGLAMVGFGSNAVVISIVTYLLDAYAHFAGSAIGAVGLVENAFIAVLPLATQGLYNNLGHHWASFFC